MGKRKFKNEKYNHLTSIDHQFKAELKDNEATITIYGEIGDYWWDSTSSSDVEKALKEVTADTVHVHINSVGGDVFDGIAIFNLLRNHSSKVVIHVDGLAASAASLIAMAGDEIVMNTGSMMMIHEASTFAFGTKTDIQKTMNALEGIDKSIADIYMTRFKGEKVDVEELIKAESWFTAEEAIELGFADEVKTVVEEVDPEDIKNNILQKFRSKNKQQVAASATTNNIMANFKRNSDE